MVLPASGGPGVPWLVAMSINSLMSMSPLMCLKYPSAFLSLSLFKIHLFIYLFLAVLDLHCCARTFSSCTEQRLFFSTAGRLLISVASLVAQHRLQVCGLQYLEARGLSNCGSWALEH